MTRIAKLQRKLIEGRPLTFAEFCRLLEAYGYRHVGTNGSHVSYRHSATADKRVVQPHGKDGKLYQVRQFSI